MNFSCVDFFEKWEPASASGRKVSWLLLIMSLLAQNLRFESRNLSDLLYIGLSLHNQIQIAITLSAIIWVSFLLTVRVLRFSHVFFGSGFWFTLLCVVYLSSSFWSIWPQYSMYRAIELIAFWFIAKHIFSHEHWQIEIHKLLLLSLVIGWIMALVLPDPSAVTQEGLVGSLRSNMGGSIAAALIIYLAFRIMKKATIWLYLEICFAAVSCVVFGSLASVVALVVGFIVLFLYSCEPLYRHQFFSLFIVVIVFGNIFLLLAPHGHAGLVEYIGAAFGKTYTDMVTWTGRFPFWAGLLDLTKNQPFGVGFAAGERTLVLLPQFTGPRLGHAHNGYFSAWLGAGWPGITLLAIFVISLWSSVRYMHPSERPLVRSLIAFLCVNNLTFTAFGGQLQPTFVLMMALACVPLKISGWPENSGSERAAMAL